MSTSDDDEILGPCLIQIKILHIALLTIRNLPIPEQDNMLSANMRKIAANALGESDLLNIPKEDRT